MIKIWKIFVFVFFFFLSELNNEMLTEAETKLKGLTSFWRPFDRSIGLSSRSHLSNQNHPACHTNETRTTCIFVPIRSLHLQFLRNPWFLQEIIHGGISITWQLWHPIRERWWQNIAVSWRMNSSTSFRWAKRTLQLMMNDLVVSRRVLLQDYRLVLVFCLIKPWWLVTTTVTVKAAVVVMMICLAVDRALA